jgi:hypothetical protein
MIFYLAGVWRIRFENHYENTLQVWYAQMLHTDFDTNLHSCL